MTKPSPFEIINRRVQNRALSERILFDLVGYGYRINAPSSEVLREWYEQAVALADSYGMGYGLAEEIKQYVEMYDDET